MKIEDEELRTLFQAESEEHIQRMDEGLLGLFFLTFEDGKSSAVWPLEKVQFWPSSMASYDVWRWLGPQKVEREKVFRGRENILEKNV